MPRPLGQGTIRILQAIREGRCYGLDIVDATGLPSGTVYPTLGRLEKRGHVRARWEDPAIAEREKRPRRRYYRLTVDGRAVLEESLEHFREVSSALGILNVEPRGESA